MNKSPVSCYSDKKQIKTVTVLKLNSGASKRAECVEALATKPDGLGVIPRTHMVDGES